MVGSISSASKPQGSAHGEASDRQAAIWDQIKATEYKGNLPQFTGYEPLFMFGYLLPWRRKQGQDYMNVTMDLQTDVMPVGRVKGIHTYGSVGKVELVVAPGHPFTGIFQGAKYGLARISPAAKPSTTIVPGMAIKFFVEGQPSINFQVMNSFKGQPSYNFFEREFTNKVADTEGFVMKTLQKVFELGSKPATEVGLKAAAAVTQDGKVLAPKDCIAPERIVLKPKVGPFAEAPHELRDDFNSIPEGSLLYEVWGKPVGSDELVKIGQLVTRSKFVSSEFGDKNLFFKHNRPD